MTNFNRVQRAIEAAINSCPTQAGRSRIEEMTVHCNGYCEPGYGSTNEDIVVTGNWNTISKYDSNTRKSIDVDKTPPRLCEVLEKMSVEIEWDDEWVACCECNGLLRTSPDSYSWKPSYVQTDDGIACENCLDGEDHLNNLEGNCGNANTISSINPEDHNYQKVDYDFESGFHWGQDADPKLIGKALEEQGIYRYLFQIDSQGQFDTRFSVWIHESEMDQFNETSFDKAKTDGPSNAARISAGLKEASKQMAQLKGEGIKYANVSSNGVEVKLVSPEDFIEGKM